MPSFIGRLQASISRLSPWFLQGPNLGAFLEAVGLTLDGAVEQLVQGMRLGQPLRCDPSALPVLSRDRRIRIYATEPEDSQRYRLSRFWPLRRQFGTHQGELRNVQPFFLDRPVVPIMRIVHQAGNGSVSTWHTLDEDGVTYSVHRADPSNWDWDGVWAKWSRWWCIIYTDNMGLAAQWEWDGGELWDGGQVWDGLLTSAEVDDIVAALREAKSAHSQLWGLILCTNAGSFDPTGTAVVNANGSTTYPTGNWGLLVDPVTGDPTRGAEGMSVVYDLGPG